MITMLTQAALAIAGVLFDSLWEGALIVGAVWAALRCLPKLGAATRYAIWLGALVALVVIPVFTVALAARPSEPATGAAVTAGQSGIAPAAAAPPRIEIPPAAAGPASAPANAAVEPDATPAAPRRATRITIPEIVAIALAAVWFLATSARVLLLLLDLRDLAVIRRGARLWPAPYEYPVFLSDRVRVPLAVGFVRPAILLPARLVTQLSAEELETIVVHEVAHLRRYDVWTNALARIAQALAAINPAAWFAMRRLTLEREVACDDWVVARTGAGDAFARTLFALATTARGRAPLAAASAFGSRHSVVVRIERLLESGPRRLRLSRPALGAAFALFAAVALVAQFVSPVLAYEPPHGPIAQSAAAPSGAGCAVPNRGIMLEYLLGRERQARHMPPAAVPLLDARNFTNGRDSAKFAVLDLTVDASGKPRKVVVVSPERYPGMAEQITRIYMASTFSPALRDCVPVTATIRTAVPVGPAEPTTGSVIVPVYPAGWSALHPAACKVPTVTHARFRPGFVPPTPYSAMLPWFPESMKNVPIGSSFRTSVRVHVDAAGAATNAALASSSGQPALDEATLSAARHAKYPLVATSCRPLPTEYVWNTTFSRNTLLGRLARTATQRFPK
jgi:TonB family protein